MDPAPVDRNVVADLVGAAVDAVPHPFIISDDETIVFANTLACALMRAAAPDALIGQPTVRLVHPDMREAYAERRPLIFERRQSIHDVPSKLIALDGAEIHGKAHLVPIQFAGRPCVLWLYNGQAPTSYRVVGCDDHPSDHEQCELVFDALPVCMLVHDLDRILAANAACRRLLGASSNEDLVGRPVGSVVHPDGQSAGMRRGEIAAAGVDGLQSVQVRLVKLDGKELRLRVDAHILRVNSQRAFLVSAAMSR